MWSGVTYPIVANTCATTTEQNTPHARDKRSVCPSVSVPCVCVCVSGHSGGCTSHMLGLIQKREVFNIPKLYIQYSIQLHTDTDTHTHTERGAS